MTRGPRARHAPDTLPRPPHWAKGAACTTAPPDLFHPEGTAAAVHLDTVEAKAWCARCSVREQCLTDALARAEQWGVWGGMDARERQALLRRRRERERSARRRAERKREE
ncbi:WhiB family transcriptional regulator [Streptomyces olivaceus]|uniref:WhiB family transcriptional regulator n=1 Tax=Streptomyces olivaceus TaxID=47716 RepID=UPI00362EB5F9